MNLASLRIVKTAIDMQTFLQGAKIGLYDATTDELIKAEITNENGEILFNDIPFGEYYLWELEAPLGYDKDSFVYTVNGKAAVRFTIEKEDRLKTIEVHATNKKFPVVPSTGDSFHAILFGTIIGCGFSLVLLFGAFRRKIKR